jgi:UDP-3-O-[3-hydroxymyristoyl] glucosamine N-acyltransferase
MALDSAITLGELTKRFGGDIAGDAAHRVSGLAPLDKAGPQQLAFLANQKYLSQVESTQAGAVLISPADLQKVASPEGRNFIVTSNPYAYFARVAQVFIDLATPPVVPGIHPSASVHPSAKVAASAVIGSHVSIEAEAVIGERVKLDAGVSIGQGVKLADDVHLYPNVTIYHGCKLGARVIIHAGAVIGADGFGFAGDFSGEGEDRTGSWVKIPQVGAVVVAQDVEIGANTTIDRAQLPDRRLYGDCGLRGDCRQHEHRTALHDWRRGGHCGPRDAGGLRDRDGAVGGVEVAAEAGHVHERISCRESRRLEQERCHRP